MLKRIAAGILLAVISAMFGLMLSAPPRVESQNVYLPQPGAIRVFQGDYIGIDMTGCGGSAAGIWVAYRFLSIGAVRPQDSIISATPPTGACPSGQAFTNAQIPLADGWLYAVQIANNIATVQEGQIWTQGFVGRGTGTLTPGGNQISVNEYPLYLFSCAPAFLQQCGWVLGQGMQSLDTDQLGRNLGVNQNQTVSNPAAGANFSTTLTQNTNLLYNVQNIRFTLVTGAGVANRYACVQFQAPAAGPIWLSACSPDAQVASSTVSYNFSIATGISPVITVVAGANPDVTIGLPALVQISDASTIASAVVNLQAADQISNIVIRTQWANYQD